MIRQLKFNSFVFLWTNELCNFVKFINAIISSSTSGLLPSRIYSQCKNPERALVAHPFNPVYMLPGVEIVPGKKTQKSYINKAKNFYCLSFFDIRFLNTPLVYSNFSWNILLCISTHLHCKKS